MTELQSVARTQDHDGKLEEFKCLAAKSAELVRTKEAAGCPLSTAHRSLFGPRTYQAPGTRPPLSH